MTKVKALILAIVMMAATASALLVTTMALFTDEVQTGNHLEAGTLEAELWQTKMFGNALDAETGRFVAYADETPIDLTGTELSEKTIFDLSGICPGIRRTAELEIRNRGDVAFTYAVTVLGVTAEGENSQALLSQMRVTVSRGGEIVSQFYLSEAESEGKETAVSFAVDKNSADAFSVTAEFVPSDENNAAKNGSVGFNLCVTATQTVPSEE